MTNTISLIDKTSSLLYKTVIKINHELQKQKNKIAKKIFDKDDYINNYIKNFYNHFENSFIDDTGFLNRFNSFDFSKISDSLKENLKEFMQDYHDLHYYNDYGYEGFTVSSFDNIYITDEHEIYADFLKKSQDYETKLELFLKLELIQAEHGIYPDIVYTGHYGEYCSDYIIPDEYYFFKTAMKHDEKKLLWYIRQLIELFDKDTWYNYTDNFIIKNFTPEFIKKLDNNEHVDIYSIQLDNDFTLHIAYEVNRKLRLEGLEKLNLKEYRHSCYGTTFIHTEVNIKNWLQNKLA